MQAGALSAEVLGRRRRAALAGRSLSSPPGRVNPVLGRPQRPSLGAAPDRPGPESGQQLGQGMDDSGEGWMESWILTPRSWEGGAQGTTLPLPCHCLLRNPALPNPHGLGHVDGATLLVHGSAPQWGTGRPSSGTASPGSTLPCGDPGPVWGAACVLGGGCWARDTLGAWE